MNPNPSGSQDLECSFIWILDQKRKLNRITHSTSDAPALGKYKAFRHRVLYSEALYDKPMWWSFSSEETMGNEAQWLEVGYALGQLDTVVEAESEIVGRENVILVGIEEGCAVGLMYLMEACEPLGAFCGCRLRIPLRSDISFIGEFDLEVEESNTYTTTGEPETPMTTAHSLEPVSASSQSGSVNNLFDNVPAEVPDQSPKAKLARLGLFLRRLRQKPDYCTLNFCAKTAINTPVFLTRTP
ncbi:unnamed protein product [Fusarium graminearum]|uniref:Uncharacterized protein n=1 Tax=Gibberella zeae TaxID=5518 RepID=A0A4U9FAR7_GIBZA|nr:hypothetical protein HG531_002285 [Fusarium graminearum]CAF3551761.1 unnamed protein product [Fusarium graminearum]CAG1964473.1 unnamed protein product [Fusarium graminearum]CAG1997784.1 unnamed protein product [Fusarium graminearum]CAG2003048.1 unnamed protein product [Fusarium graminearum]